MPTFKYKALQANGSVAEGVLEATGRPEALRVIESRGLRPVNLVEKAGAAPKKGGAAPAAGTAAPLNFSFSASPSTLEGGREQLKKCCTFNNAL